MKKLNKIQIILTIFLFLYSSAAFSSDFGAYYTQLDYEDKISGKYADIVVQFDKNRRFVFSRESSYLPYWQSEKGRWYVDGIVKRNGDGLNKRPDKYNKYSYARLIENSPEKVVVHWRYIPDFSNVQWDGVVDEYYTITTDGKVLRKIKKGTTKVEEWENAHNVTVQRLVLKPEGIEEVFLQRAVLTDWKGQAIEGTAVKNKPMDNIAASWRFDEGLRQRRQSERDITTEDVSGLNCVIEGHKTLWKKGVSGTALAFDGYYSAVTLPAEHCPDTWDGFTIECWVALGAYPFDWAPLVQQCIWGKSGYYFGIDEKGHVGFHISVNDSWESVSIEEELELFTWHHVAASFDSTGQMNVYIDGKEKVSRTVSGDRIVPAGKNIVIGLNSEKMPAIEGRIRKGKWPSLFGIDGLIDEVVIYNAPLSSAQIQQSYRNLDPGPQKHKEVDLQARRFPANPRGRIGGKFAAEYTKFNYYETWDNLWRVSEHPDIIVKFDELPVHIVFWRGISSGPALITENGKWGADQSSENYRELDAAGEAEGCCEFMSDKQCRHSHVRIIENNDARVIIHWRYGLVDSLYFFVTEKYSEGDWADEYWTIYPDGVAVRHLARGKIWGDSWVETLFYSPPGTMPEDNVELEAYTLVNMAGEMETYSWENGSPECDLPDPVISMINTKSLYRPFNIYPAGSSVETFPGRTKPSRFHWWNHFPVSQIISDGRSAKASDRAAHSSLVWGSPSQDYLMYGFSNEPASTLLSLAGSWNNPPGVKDTVGVICNGYQPQQRAYLMTATSQNLSFELVGSEKNPIINPCFVICNWGQKDAGLKINGQEIRRGDSFRYGHRRTAEGVDLIVWIKKESAKPTEFTVLSLSN